MKRLFTIAVVAMLTSLAFAQAPLAKKALSSNKIEKLISVDALSQKAKQAKEMKAAMAEKAAAANEKSSSVFRKNSVNINRGKFDKVKGGKVITSLPLMPMNDELSNAIYKATTHKTTTQEGNVTVTTDDNGIITDVEGVEAKLYMRATTGTAYLLQGGNMVFTSQSGMVTIIEDGNNVYIKDPITALTVGTWVKGTKDGNTITVAAHQPLLFNTYYSSTVSLRWGVISASGSLAAADDHAEAFTYTIDGDVLTLQGTNKYDGSGDAYYMGALIDANDGASGYGDAETVLTYDPTYVAPSTELVTVPAGLETTDWYMNCMSTDGENDIAVKNHSIKVGFDGNDIYVQGISAELSTAWVKGTIDGTNIIFDKFQYVGQYQGYDCWFIGGEYDAVAGEITFVDAKATYDADSKTITFIDDVVINADAFKLYYLEWFFDVVLTGEPKEYEEPIITDLTAELPYSNTFDTPAEQAEAAIYDANEDQSTFTIETEAYGLESPVARYRYNDANSADDYLVFPGVELKAGKKYKVSVDASGNSGTYPERFEVLAGTIAKASQLTIPVIEPTDVTSNKEFATYTNDAFSVEEDGTYYIAVHAISDPGMFYLFIDNFSIKECDDAAPAAINDLAVTPGEEGALKATIEFTAPAKTIGDTDITEALTVDVKRNGETVKTLSDVAAGSKQSVIDENVPTPGEYTYSVQVSYDTHIADPVSQNVYIGADTPNPVENLTATDKSGSVDLAWEAPTAGVNGGYINPATFKYNVYPVEMVEFWGMLFPSTDFENPYVTGLTETSANVAFDTNEGDHQFTYFAVTTENEAGESEETLGAVVTGKPFELPVFDSVTDGQLSYWWGTACDPSNQSLEGGLYIGETSSDGDGTCFQFAAETAGWMTLESGKIALNGAVNPVATFDYSGDVAAELAVTVITPKGEKEMTTLTAGTDFAPASISLKEFANEDWVRVIITSTFASAGNAYVDNVRIYNQLDNNLVAKGIKATSKVQAGEDVTVTVNVENQGSLAAAADAYTVELYCNDEKVDSKAGVELAANATAAFEFTQPTNVMSPAEMTWKAIVVFEADEDKSNNETATAKTTIKTNNYPAVTDLAGEQNGEDVVLTWTEPDMTAAQPTVVTDDFESYDGFTTDAGEWTFVDVDDAEVGGFQGMDFSVDGVNILQSHQSFWVHDVTDEATWNQTFAANSGVKYLAAMFRYDDGQADDWAISPVLSGNAQTVSFYAKSYSSDYPENIEVYYSTGSKNPADFVKVMDKVVVPGDWTEYTAALPEGAKYFAIRSCASSSFMLMVDDVTYEMIDVPTDLSIAGYNVYRDGVKINDATVEETTYTDATAAEGNHSYAVTVVYDKGESKASNIATIVVSGISEVIFDSAKAANIYSVDGTLVRSNATSVKNLKKGIYVINGKKVVVK